MAAEGDPGLLVPVGGGADQAAVRDPPGPLDGRPAGGQGGAVEVLVDHNVTGRGGGPDGSGRGRGGAGSGGGGVRGRQCDGAEAQHGGEQRGERAGTGSVGGTGGTSVSRPVRAGGVTADHARHARG